MLTHTSETAIRALIYMALNRDQLPMTPRLIATRIDASPTYLVKTLRLLVRAGVLRSHRGAQGGVELGREPEEVTLLEVVEACQGLIVGSYCTALDEEQTRDACAFHQAMQEVHEAMVGALTRWTLADMTARPLPEGPALDPCRCKMAWDCRNAATRAGTTGHVEAEEEKRN